MIKEEYCKKLKERHKELFNKQFILQDYKEGENIKYVLSAEEQEEFEDIKNKLRHECELFNI